MPWLYLIRHPHTQIDPARPASQWSLSDQGRAQVRALMALPLWKHVAAVYTSAQPKASAVGEAAHTVYAVPWHIQPALDEARRDTWLGGAAFQTAQRAFFAQPETPPVRGWESARQAGERFAGAMDSILGAHPAATIAVIAHATVLTLYVARLRACPPTYEDWRAVDFAAIMVVDRATRRPLTPFVAAPYDGLPPPTD